MEPALAIIGLGPTELIILLVVVLLVFGNRLPAAMRSLGRGITEFKKGVQGDDDSEQSIDKKE